MKLERTDAGRIAVLCAELNTVRLDGGCVLASITSEVREILDSEAVLVYSVAERLDGWELGRWHQGGGSPRCGELLRQALARKAPASYSSPLPVRRLGSSPYPIPSRRLRLRRWICSGPAV